MLNDLVINAAILIAAISIGNQIFRDTALESTSPIHIKVLSGLICGVLGILLMVYCVKVDKTTIIDFRNISILIAGTLGGTIPIAISALIIGLFRIVYYGINNSSFAALIIEILAGIGISIIFRKKLALRVKWFCSTVYFLVISTVALIIVLRGNALLLSRILIFYILGTIIVAFVTYRYMNYLQDITILFRTLKDESKKDYLTGLYNVRQFDIVVNQLSERMSNNCDPISLLFIDIDFFKKVNDTYGHQEGDRVLKELGKILSRTCRACDIVSRNGGEEFSVILEDCAMEQAVEIAQRIRKNIESHNFIISNAEVIHITVSIGVSSFPESTKFFNMIMEDADKALYIAKRLGRNRVVFDIKANRN